MNSKGFTPIVILLVVAALGVIVLGAVYLYSGGAAAPATSQQNQITQTPSQPSSVAITSSSVALDIPTWKIYHSDQYGFEFKYPSGWQLAEHYKNGDTFDSKCVKETHTLLELSQSGSQQNGSAFSDGAFLYVAITGTSTVAEYCLPGVPKFAGDIPVLRFTTTTPAGWVKNVATTGLHATEEEPIALPNSSLNGFAGTMKIAFNGDMVTSYRIAEQGGAYRILPNGRALLISWVRDNPNSTNDFSYEKYLLPILSTWVVKSPN